MNHSKFLTRCIQLANYGRGTTSPNPLVGAVIVHNDRIIGEGYHRKAGEPHAEVMAINSVKEKELLKYSTLYCSLEPCAHYGRTPPCCELITSYAIPKVVIGTTDPHDKVDGKGIDHLVQHGVNVEFAPSSRPYQRLNEVFWINRTKNRPFFTLKWAETTSGHVDSVRNHEEDALKISGPIAAIKSHQLRAQVDGILITSKTAFKDRPRLSLRSWAGKNPVPIILKSSEYPIEAQWLLSLNTKSVIISENFEPHCIHISSNPRDFASWTAALLDLGLNHILVEGGSRLLQNFIDHGLADAIHTYISNDSIVDGVGAPKGPRNGTQNRLGKDAYVRH